MRKECPVTTLKISILILLLVIFGEVRNFDQFENIQNFKIEFLKFIFVSKQYLIPIITLKLDNYDNLGFLSINHGVLIYQENKTPNKLLICTQYCI